MNMQSCSSGARGMINPDECLEKARECIVQAGETKNEEAKAEFLQLAAAWMQLAEEAGQGQDLGSLRSTAPARFKQCLAQAEICRALAATSAYTQRKVKLLELAAKWAQLAANAASGQEPVP